MSLATYAAVDGDESRLLLQVQERLIDRVKVGGNSAFNDKNCFVTEEPIPPETYFSQGRMVCTVCLGDGQFDEYKYDGGGANQLTEHVDLLVSVFTRTKLDQPPQATYALLDEERGMSRKLKPALLEALLVEDPDADILIPWIPLNSQGQPFLRNPPFPRRSQGPRQLQGMDWLGLTLSFGVEFDWDLTTK